MAGLFITGTDTGVGKTIFTAALAGALKDQGLAGGSHETRPVRSRRGQRQ